MRNNSIKTAAFVAGIFSTVAFGADAAIITPTGSVGGAPTGVVHQTFDGLTPGNTGDATIGIVTVKFTGGSSQPVQGALGGQYAAPYLSNGNGAGFGGQPDGADTTTYLSTGIGSIELDFSQNLSYLGLLWGSIDNYNTIAFYDGNTFLGSFAGSDILAGANGDQGVNGTLYVNFNSDTLFNRVVFSSTQYAFEFDNVAYNQTIDQHVPAPEPVTLTPVWRRPGRDRRAAPPPQGLNTNDLRSTSNGAFGRRFLFLLCLAVIAPSKL